MRKMRIGSKTRQQNYIFGDFDKDGTPNIDDPYPFNARISKPKSDVSLATELSTIEKESNKFVTPTKDVARKLRQIRGAKIKYRIKSPFSIINKLRRKYFGNLKDIGGLTVITDDVWDAQKFVEQNFKVLEIEDYYKNPRYGYYRAIHYVVMYRNKPFEIQIKKQEDWSTAQKYHKDYKSGKLTP